MTHHRSVRLRSWAVIHDIGNLYHTLTDEKGATGCIWYLLCVKADRLIRFLSTWVRITRRQLSAKTHNKHIVQVFIIDMIRRILRTNFMEVLTTDLQVKILNSKWRKSYFYKHLSPEQYYAHCRWADYKYLSNKMLSYTRETALQGALVLAKSGRLELGDNILTQNKSYYAVQGHTRSSK